MMKYLNTEITFAEVPDEISLCINILGCDRHCKGCHSPFLWDGSMDNYGKELTIDEVDRLIDSNPGISCICLMGGLEFTEVDRIAAHIKARGLKSAWYIYKDELQPGMHWESFDYIKFGPYIEDRGPLTSETTNQVMYLIHEDGTKEDITWKFRRKGPASES